MSKMEAAAAAVATPINLIIAHLLLIINIKYYHG